MFAPDASTVVFVLAGLLILAVAAPLGFAAADARLRTLTISRLMQEPPEQAEVWLKANDAQGFPRVFARLSGKEVCVAVGLDALEALSSLKRAGYLVRKSQLV